VYLSVKRVKFEASSNFGHYRKDRNFAKFWSLGEVIYMFLVHTNERYGQTIMYRISVMFRVFFFCPKGSGACPVRISTWSCSVNLSATTGPYVWVRQGFGGFLDLCEKVFFLIQYRGGDLTLHRSSFFWICQEKPERTTRLCTPLSCFIIASFGLKTPVLPVSSAVCHLSRNKM
jgi:hypothetical protein